ncbi:MAG: LamG-like jellyroll fold domain-containing protein [bacterium]|nr:LamG-like jellyroll fold domain-containing protein [bacterium]
MKIFNKLSFLILALLFISNTPEIKAQMFWNNAATFTGSNSSYVAVRHATELNITGSFTIEAWVCPTNVTSPPFQIILQKRNAGANGYTLYLSNGKVAIRTNSNTRLIGKGVISSNAWTHIAGTYDVASNLFTTYINGNFDTSVVSAAAQPVANTDSVWIGKGFNDPFAGKMDEVRIWNKANSTSEIYMNRRTSLGSRTGIYSALVMSLTFQDNDANGIAFSLTDWSGNGNSGTNRGVTAFDMSNRPLQTIQTNDCVELDGVNDYLAAVDNALISPTSQITMSAWIYPRLTGNSVLIQKGNGTGAATNYRLAILNNLLYAGINGNFNYNDVTTLKLFQWTHVAFTYNGLNGSYQFFINGVLTTSGTNIAGNITDSPDSLYIGGSIFTTDFDGYIDEVRILPDVKFAQDINRFMFKSIDLSNGPGGSYAVYNLDGYAAPSGVGTTPVLNFRNEASFANCGSSNDQPQSPMNRADNLNFADGYYLKSSNKRVPPTGTGGTATDSLIILNQSIISDINVFVALNHNQEQHLEISLIGPNGDVVMLYDQNTLVSNADHLITIFDDNADSSLVNGRYVSFSPRIKPFANLNSVFTGDSTNGLWRLVVRDVAALGGSDTGMLYSWGIQLNNMSTKPYQLDFAGLIQGFYNPSTNNMVRDTMRFYLRNTVSPFSIDDSAKAYLTINGRASLIFANTSSGVGHYLQCRHRNTIQTWNNQAIYFNPLTNEGDYDFRTSSAQAFGNNMILVDNTPVRYAFYSGDVDQDDQVDATDVLTIYNDVLGFNSGYINTDITGDNFTDASDLVISFNNSKNFVSAVTPLPMPLINPSNTEAVRENRITTDPSGSSDQSGTVRNIRKKNTSERPK